MTTVLPGTRDDNPFGHDRLPLDYLDDERPARRQGRISRFFHDPAWPVVALLAWWPLWWASGIGDYAPVVLAIPMARRLYLWRAHNTRRIKAPPGFGWWLLFLVVMMFGVLELTLTAPDTMPGTASTRFISWLTRAVSYFAYTVVLLYVGNLTEKEMPRRRLAWLLGLVGIYAVVFGYLALVIPKFTFTAPITPLIPQSIQQASQGQVFAMLHPSMTQLESFNGHGRVTAPFLYANTWGNNIAITLPYLIVIWKTFRKRWQRRLVYFLMVASIIPMLLSFDRGLWVAILVGIFYLAIRLAMMGRKAMLGVIIAGLLAGVVAYFATPIHTVVTQRLQNGYSDGARTQESVLSLEAGLASPFIGYGDTRREFGSVKSISVGRTAKCTACGQRSAGSNGQLWLLLITTGLLGTVLYSGFFIYGMWRYWKDRTPLGMTAVLVLLLGFVFGGVYDAIGATMAFTMLAYVLLWRNDVERRHEYEESLKPQQAPPEPPPTVDTGPRAITMGPTA